MESAPKGYDSFASEFFSPIYPAYASRIIDRTNVRNGRVLDLGCGGGFLGFALYDLADFDDVTFLDTSAKALEQARCRAEALAYPEGSCHYVEQDACDLSCFEDNAFSLVVSRGSMQFWKDREAAFREIHRVLKPGGYCYIGGGVGVTNRQTDRLDAIMDRRAREYGVGSGEDAQKASDHRKQARTQQCVDYAQLFSDLNCSYALINSKSEGGWFIFCKDDELTIW